MGNGYAGAVVEKGLVCTLGERDGKFFVSGIRDRDGKLLWTTEIVEKDVDKARDRSYTASTPTMDSERIYALTKGGFLVCLKTATGERVWQKSYKHDFSGVRPWFSCVCVGERLYNISREGDVVVLAASRRHELLARNRVGEGSHSTPAVVGGRLYLE